MPRLRRHYAFWPSGVPHTLEAKNCNIFEHLAQHAVATPDATAISFYGHALTYRELHAAVLALAGYLQQRLDLRRGDRALVLMPNCPQFVIAYYAVLRCDAVVVVAANTMSTADEVDWYAADAGAKVVLTTQEMLERIEPLRAAGTMGCVVAAMCELAGNPNDFPHLRFPDFASEPGRQLPAGVHGFAGAIAAGIAPTLMQGGVTELAVIAYTSGTTGKPKGAMLTHRNFAHASAQRACWFGERAEDRELVVLPMGHLAGMNIMNLAIFVGRHIELLARWDADNVLELIERVRIAAWGAVTPMLAEVFGRADIGRRDLSSLRRLYGGATAMPEALIARVEQRVGIAFVESYGLTEACGATHINPPEAARRQCVGVPHINCDARIIDPETGVELGPNQPGEIVSNSPTVFAGYWNNPEATAQAFVVLDGRRFLRSGDIGHHDEDGYFYVTDRLKRMINASGLKVWPAEIESALYAHPAVQEACVISAYDPKRGETVKALVVLRETMRGSLTPQQLSDWSRARLAAYKVPRIVEFVDVLPKTTTGKMLWRELQACQDERDQALRRA